MSASTAPRIVHLISSRRADGGAERILAALARATAERGWPTTVLNPFADPGETDRFRRVVSPAAYEPLSADRILDLPGLWVQLRRRVRVLRPDLVHAHLFHAMAAAASLTYPSRPRLVLTHHHAVPAPLRRDGLRALIERVAIRRFDRVVAVSDAVRDRLGETFPNRTEIIQTIPNGWAGTPTPPVDGDRATVVSVGRLEQVKGHDTLIRAFAMVADEHPDVDLVIAGDGPERTRLGALVSTAGVADRVHIAGPVEDVWPLLARADVFALTSCYETAGIAVLEAMAAGLPVVATRVGGLPETVEDDVTGLLVPPEDPDATARALGRLLHDPGLRRRMGDAGRRRAAESTIAHTTRAYLALYERLLRRSGVGR